MGMAGKLAHGIGLVIIELNIIVEPNSAYKTSQFGGVPADTQTQVVN
jgi:hypothetical protein